MRTSIFAISLLLALGVADAKRPGGGKRPKGPKPGKGPQDSTEVEEEELQLLGDCSIEEFSLWAAEFGANYEDTKDFNRHYKKWCKTDVMIKENKKGRKGKRDELRLEHNRFSATLPEERRALGRLSEIPEDAETSCGEKRLLSDERQLQSNNTTPIDWVNGVDGVGGGKVIGVKDQGMCGSCYAFSGNTALESHIAIKEGTAPVHLSEQEIVDCSSSYGNWACNGGLEIYNWAYQRDNGAVTNAEYPYVSGTTRDANSTCGRGTTASSAVVTGWGVMRGTGAQGIIDLLQDGPVAIGMQGENQAFYNYNGGILTSSTCDYSRMDHAVVVVGYNPGTDADPDAEPEITTTTTTKCKRARSSRRNRRRRRACNTRKGWYQNEEKPWLCCKDFIDTTVIDNSVGQDAYFLIQNSWGTGWGESGFARMAVELSSDTGPCGINVEPLWVTGNSVTA